MSSPSSLTGLKTLQWLFRGIEFGCSIGVLGIYSYYLATMIKHDIAVPMSVKAVEGISGIGTIYTTLGILLVCSCAGHPAPSFVALIFDIGLAGAFIYVAVANREGAGSCTGAAVGTVYGSGEEAASPGDGLPTFRMACQMEKACLAVACIASVFFILSTFLEIKINRSRYRLSRPIRDAEGEDISKSDHYGAPPQRRDMQRGFLGLGSVRSYGLPRGRAPPIAHPDQLPVHQQFSDARERRVEVPAWGDVSSLHDSDRLYFNDGEPRDEHDRPLPPVRITSTTAPRPAAGVYNEGAFGDIEYPLYPDEGQHGNDRRESEAGRDHRESKAARLERLAAA